MWVACVKQAIRCLGRGPGEDKEEHKPHLDEAEYVQQLFEAAGQIDLSFKMRVVNSLKASGAKHPALQRRRRGILGLSSTLNIQLHTQEAGDDQSVARRSQPLTLQEAWDLNEPFPPAPAFAPSVWAPASLSSSPLGGWDSALGNLVSPLVSPVIVGFMRCSSPFCIIAPAPSISLPLSPFCHNRNPHICAHCAPVVLLVCAWRMAHSTAM